MKPLTPEEVLAKKQEEYSLAENNTILRVVAGSRAYGTNLPTSDYDERGVFIDIPQRVCLPFNKLEQVQLPYDDIVLFELSKYMNLLQAQNPNIMELIWTAPEDVKFVSDAGRVLLENREKFLSKDVVYSYSHYAFSQLGRIKGHNTWINNPQPEEAPKQSDFISVVYNLSSSQEFNKGTNIDHNQYKALKLKDGAVALFHKDYLGLPERQKGWIDRLGNPAFSTSKEIAEWFEAAGKAKGTFVAGQTPKPELLVKVNKEGYQEAARKHKDYWEWKANRNEVRSALEAAHGYDTKHGMHLIRLLRTGIEILDNRAVSVRRPDAQELLDIRNGKFTYEQLVAEAHILQEKIQAKAEKSSLPSKVDLDVIKEVTFEIYKKHWMDNKMFDAPVPKLNRPKMG